MNIKFKGLKIGNIIITTQKQLETKEINMSAEEVWGLFMKAINEKKIVFNKEAQKE